LEHWNGGAMEYGRRPGLPLSISVHFHIADIKGATMIGAVTKFTGHNPGNVSAAFRSGVMEYWVDE